MSILIKGMEMPKNCRDCGIEQEGFWCGALEGYQNTRCFTNERREDCPLVPVPPHGRLIDADANLSVMRRVLANPYSSNGTIDTAMLKACIAMFEDAPTIIPAEEGENAD